ncbi:MAG: LysM peptidoglycan-binding domain-containing protein [Moraxellaceae bacterium]|nr:LysM peptidoglycan-binding domain-containing protein [Moraxellaceae bacterium]
MFLCLLLLVMAPTASAAGWVDRLFGSPGAKAEPTVPPPGPSITSQPYSPAAHPIDRNKAPAPAMAMQDEEGLAALPHIEETELTDEDLLPSIFSADELATEGNLWDRLRNGFKMDLSVDNERIAVQRQWYAQRQDYLDRVAIRAARYLHYTVTEAEKRGIPTELALLPVIESAYDPFAYSHARAAGMWQFIPGTGSIYGLKQNWWYDGRRDVIESTRAAYEFLTSLYQKFGSWELALASYNAGPGAVQRAINRNAAAGLPTDFWSLRLPAETMAYVPRFLGMAQLVQSPEAFGVTLRPVLDHPYFREIQTSGQIDLAAAAEIAGISTKELYQLNPGFNRWATDPDGPHRLLVPAALPMDFEADIAQLPAPERVFKEEYVVRKGDTLFAVAQRFKLAPAELRRMNGLKSDRLAVGSTLAIARPRASDDSYVLSHEQRMARQANKACTIKRTHYTVRKGDSLYAIARKHNVSAGSLAAANGLRINSPLRIGQTLKIEKSGASSNQRIVASKSKKGDTAGTQKRIRYQVKAGDTLSSISRRYNVSIQQIKRWNGTSHRIQPGQGLVLFVASH